MEDLDPNDLQSQQYPIFYQLSFRNLLEQQLANAAAIHNLGIDNFGWAPAFTDYKVILEQMKTGDEMLIYESIMNLQQQLSIAQENTLRNFPLDQYLPELVQIINRPMISDLSNEITSGAVVANGAVKSLTEVLERTMGFIDLNEACIKCLEKISLENPYAILTSGSLPLCLNMMDFFEIATQKRILNLLLNVSKNAAQENELREHLIPMLPTLCMLLHSRGDHAQGKIESVSNITLKICEGIIRMVSPHSQFDKVTDLYDKIGETGIIDAILSKLEEFCISDLSVFQQPNLINQTTQKVLSTVTVQNFLRLLAYCGKYSLKISRLILDQNVLRQMDLFLPSSDDIKKNHFSSEQYPYITEAINLLDSLFPDREDASTQGEVNQPRLKFIQTKVELFKEQAQQGKIAFIAEKILPKIFNVYENNIQTAIRSKTLMLIDKIIYLFNDELLNNFIEPYQFAKFIYSNLRSKLLASIQVCLQMTDKLMKSNPKTYTLPLIREGVREYIKQLTPIEQLEKLVGIKLDISEKNETQSEREDFLAKAKALILQREQTDANDKNKLEEFEQTIQKYMELSRIHQILGSQPSKSQNDQAKQIITLAQSLNENFFQNEAFLQKMNEWYEQEFKFVGQLKELSEVIIEEAKRDTFDQERTFQVLDKLADALTSSKQIMLYEFKESGLLQALELFLTHTPSQVSFLTQQSPKSENEELKQSEQEAIRQRRKEVTETVRKKEARTYMQRLRVFAMVMLKDKGDKKPLKELIQLSHQVLSESEYLIFQNTSQQSGPFTVADDPNQSINALKQLTKRIRVNLIYDPTKSFLKSSSSTLQESESMMQIDQSNQLDVQMIMQKSQSAHPAFMHLSAQQQQPLSKVFMKRNMLYSELKQVLISVEQCASLWIIEDFLRTKIKTNEDVKNLKQPMFSHPPSFYSYLKQGQNKEFARELLERYLDRLRDLMQSPPSDEAQFKQETLDFAEDFTDELTSTNELNDEEQQNLARHLELQILQVVDEHYAQWENEMHEEGDDEILEKRMIDIQKAIEVIRELSRAKRSIRKEEQRAESLKQIVQIDPELKKDQEMQDNTLQTLEEEKKQEQRQEQEDSSIRQETEKDVEMTDQEEDSKQHSTPSTAKSKYLKESAREVELSVEDTQDQLSLGMDLDTLIKETGEDTDYEFYYNGQLLGTGQTIFEIMKSAGKKAQTDKVDFYFVIKDKRDDITMARKDSLLEFASKRERTKSEAVGDFSVSYVNQMVQQLLQKEFQIFNQPIDQADNSKEFKQLEQSLKILKVLNFIYKNIHLLSNQGINFIIHNENEEQKQDSLMSDFELQFSLSSLNANLFHHHKLDSFIMRNIQDPFTLIGGGISDTLQQIFRSCSFLFPFQTRLLFFKLISFIGSIDMNRSIFFLRQFLKQKHGKIPQDDKNVKFHKQKVIVDRERILDSAFVLIKQINKRAFLEIQYKDEAGTGLGPTLEFYYLISNTLRNAQLPSGHKIWRKGMQDNSLFPAPTNIHKMNTDELQKIYELFRLAGLMVAKSISDDRLIDLPISSLLWDLLLGKKMNIFDLERIDSDMYKIFAELQILANKKKNMDKQVFLDQDAKDRYINTIRTTVIFTILNIFKQGARVEDIGLSFTLPGYDDIELKPNGRALDVTLNNLQEYIDLVMHFTFHETIKIPQQAFKKGFNSIFPIDSLRPFATTNELEDMICGIQRNDDDWTISKLSECVVPMHGYHSKSMQYLDLLKFMNALDHEERRKFLKFVTGSPRLPNGGFAQLDPKLTVVLKKPLNAMESPDDILPSVMTCQNYIKLPSYTSYERLKEKFQQAYEEGCNNFTLS